MNERPDKVVDTNIAIAEALGLDARQVSSIHIDITGSDYPVVDVRFKLRDGLADEFTTSVDSKFKLVPVEDEPDPA